jgi:hypothetical protein
MHVELPTWFKYRQGKAEPAGDDVLRLTAPNLPEAYVGVRRGEGGRWAGFLRAAAGGPDLAATAPEFERENDAWQAAFELHRSRVVYQP